MCSGNAMYCWAPKEQDTVYPRVLGERSKITIAGTAYYGLSPCARGTRLVVVGEFDSSRFIPVCSGNANKPPTSAIGYAVYPRVLGERSELLEEQRRFNGLSPCARGTPSRVQLPPFNRRFIPVCSGNALAS